MIRALRYALVFLACAFTFTAFAEIQEEDNVLVLTDENFDEAIKQHELILVEFYAPWCGHCKKLAPEWAKAAKTLKEQENPLPLAKVDATEEKELAERFEIRGFPTIKLFRNGNPTDYNGGRTEQDIVTWFNKKAGPAAKTLNTEAELQAFQEANAVNVIGFLNSLTNEQATTFLAAAANDDSNSYAFTSSPELRAKFGIPDGQQVVVLSKPYDEKRNDFTFGESASLSELQQFVQANSRPLVQFFTKETAQQIFSSPIQVHFLFFTNDQAEYHNSVVETFTDVAKQIRGKALVVNIPHTENRILDYFSIAESDLPVAFIADMRSGSGMKKFKVEGELAAANIVSTFGEFFEGRLKPTLKSEAPAADDTAGNVVVVKGQTFDELVLNNDKDVFVEFYAPWCGHCKKLAPIWDELGDKYASSDKIVIAKMDATANEIDVNGVEVQGFPTLYFFKGNDKTNPIKYEGARDLDALTAFVQENAVNQFQGSDEL